MSVKLPPPIVRVRVLPVRSRPTPASMEASPMTIALRLSGFMNAPSARGVLGGVVISFQKVEPHMPCGARHLPSDCCCCRNMQSTSSSLGFRLKMKRSAMLPMKS